MARLRVVGASASASASSAASGAQASLETFKSKSEAYRARIYDLSPQAAPLPGLLSNSLVAGLNDAYRRLCIEAESRGQTGLCASEGEFDAGDASVITPDPTRRALRSETDLIHWYEEQGDELMMCDARRGAAVNLMGREGE